VRTTKGLALRPKGRQTVPAGDRLILEMPGGGGVGDALDRPSAEVARDVRNGIVSVEGALRDYGVVADARGTVDEAASDAERARRRGAPSS